MNSITLSSPVSVLNGVGKSRCDALARLGIHTVRDLLFYTPRAYENRGNIKTLGSFDLNIPRAYILTVATQVSNARLKKNMTISKFRAFDDTGSCEVIFFNSPFVKDVFHVGSTYRFYGKAAFSKTRKLTLTSPSYEPIIDGVPLPDFTPIYSLTEGVTSKLISKLISEARERCLPYLSDTLPEAIRVKHSLPTLSYAINNIHSPVDEESLDVSRRRLAFDEMLHFALSISMSAGRRVHAHGVRFSPCSLTPFTDRLPYELTGAQKRTVNDIYRDTVLKEESGKTPAMARIIVGDVGSGKTVCASAAVYIAKMSGYQSVLMAPTEILAVQHYKDLNELLSPLGFSVKLLTGSTKLKEKNLIYEEAASGEVDLIIGTHALLSDKLDFNKLGLIITDEQHRFGVAQRAKMKEKVEQAHMLVMSATPIPRSLALALYGDLDVSRIDELPRGRQRIDTFVVNEEYRVRLNDFIKKQVALGGQCYVICPAIEEGDESEAEYIDMYEDSPPAMKYVITHTNELKAALPGIKIEYLHGKMKNSEKEEIMSRFLSGEISVLVSTTVIEVGVNVPNATLMIIENADRFGLAQLHQLRGRVGRGSKKSYCVLVSDNKSEKSRARLDAIKGTNDGYEIAEKDLLLRGPGEFFASGSDNNIKQSGGFDLRYAKQYSDTSLFEKAFSTAKEIIAEDPELMLTEHIPLRNEIASRIADISTLS